jgi:hypothetical protein
MHTQTSSIHFLSPYSFQGQEHDDEIMGEGNSYSAEFWQYDSRLVRRWNIDPVVKPWESSYACFADNAILYIDPDGADKIKFDKEGNYLSGEKKGKLHEFLFGSKGVVLNDDGSVLREFKFNNRKIGQVEKFEGFEDQAPEFSGVDLDFEAKIEEIVSVGTQNAPEGSVWNKEKREWIKNSSSTNESGGAMETPMDYMSNNVDWGGDGFIPDGRIRVVGDKGYDDFDAGNLLWGRSMQKIGISLLVTRLGAHYNAFIYGKKQFVQKNLKGEEILFSIEEMPKFQFRQITWLGDSHQDQKAIKHGYRIGRKSSKS